MLRRIVIVLLLGAFVLPAAGCMTNRPVMWSWPHHKRRMRMVLDGFHRFHMDFDRIIFDMDDRPLEDVD